MENSPAKLKILMPTDVFFPDTIGGAGRVAYHLSRELAAGGHEIHVLTRNPSGRLPAEEEPSKGFFIHRFHHSKRPSMHFILSEIINTYRRCRQFKGAAPFDLVCIHQSMAAIGPLLSGMIKDIPRIYYYHSPWHEEFLIKTTGNERQIPPGMRIYGRFIQWIENQVLCRSDRVVTLSRFMAGKVGAAVVMSRLDRCGGG